MDDASIFYTISLIIDKELGLSEEKQDVFLNFLQPFCLFYLNSIATQLFLLFKEGLDNIFLSFLNKSQQGFNEESSIGTVEMVASILKSFIIVLLMVIDLLGQNQPRKFIELSRQVLGKDIATCPTVTVIEWMDIFKKIVSSTSLDKVWDRMVVYKTNPLCQHNLNLFLLLRWDIDDFASLVVLDKDRFLPKKLSIEFILW